MEVKPRVCVNETQHALQQQSFLIRLIVTAFFSQTYVYMTDFRRGRNVDIQIISVCPLLFFYSSIILLKCLFKLQL